jgi:hypothetical protein
MALRAPWYACERAKIDRFDERAASPVIQKYDTSEFVRSVLADPSASLRFGQGDVWTFPVPRSKTAPVSSFRERLSPYRLASSCLLKLYQPSHERFYTVAVELFCDGAGLPRPGPDDDVSVRFVVRRIATRTGTSTQARDAVRDLVKAAAKELYGTPYPTDPKDVVSGASADPASDHTDDVAAMLGLDATTPQEQAARERFELDHHDLIEQAGVKRELQGWYVDADGSGRWIEVPGPGDPAPSGTELELPMWRVPGAQCPGPAGFAPQRSLWFGAIPTYSGDLDDAGRPRLDDRSTYVIQCIARRRRPGCPPLITVGAATRAYRLAAFLDPAGTANRRVHVRMPDFAAVAAQAAQGGPSGGVVFERPPGSQLPAGPLGQIPTSPIAVPPSARSENCSFSIELITIVASFVLAIFLPVVVFVFQLWWMLLLKFCWPRSDEAVDVIGALGAVPITGLDAARDQKLGRMLGVDEQVAQKLFEPDANDVKSVKEESKAFAEATAQQDAPAPKPEVPEPPVTDPLCPAPTVRLR